MVRIAPIRLSFNPKTLWFDAGTLDLSESDAVVVTTVRGEEFGHVANSLFDMDYEQTKKLKSPLKPVLRLASETDLQKAQECEELSMAALPVFKRLARELTPDMNPVAVEYLFNGEKAVFYFDAEDRVDFRELVRKLSNELRVRVDMKQIGVRDGARMVGGLGHCGQELCCARLGGDFNPVSIRMAKEQDLSLNPQKISGVCGRLMCCLRYEFEAYKDFHSRAPKKNAKIATPAGEGKVVELNVPREIISIKVGDEKPVKVPLSDMEPPEGGTRPNSVGDEAWERASTPIGSIETNLSGLFATKLSGDDKLAEKGKVTHVDSANAKKKGKKSRKGSGENKPQAESSGRNQRKPRRRRSTTVQSDGSAKTERQNAKGASKGAGRPKGSPDKKRQGQQGSKKTVQVGRNSSGLRSNRQESQGGQSASGSNARRRRRSHKTGNSNAKNTE